MTTAAILTLISTIITVVGPVITALIVSKAAGHASNAQAANQSAQDVLTAINIAAEQINKLAANQPGAVPTVKP
jgi:hypothetical protein